MISIRQLTGILFFAYLVLLFVGLLLVRWFWFYPAELELVSKNQERELDSVHSTLYQQKIRLMSLANDYAEWDATYQYVRSPIEHYVKENFVPESFHKLNIDKAVIINEDKQILLNLSFNARSFELSTNEHDLANWLINIAKEIDYVSRYPISFNYLNNQLYLIAVNPVSSSDGRSPNNGYLAFAQAISPRFWHSIQQQTRVKVEPLATTDFSSCLPFDTPIQQPQNSYIRCLYDIKQNPTVAVKLSTNAIIPSFMRLELYPTFFVISVIPGLLFLLFLQFMIKPLQQATRALQNNLAKGQLHTLFVHPKQPLKVRELMQLRNAYNDLVVLVRQQQERLELLSNTDRLTNIANRRAFDDALTNTWQRLQRHQQSMVLIMCDIDYFKPFNDHYGHGAGDVALQQVAQALATAVQRSDEIVTRYGGEEFAIIAYVDDAIELNQLRLRLANAIHRLRIPHEYSQVRDIVTVSFGMAWIKESGPWLTDYQAKDWLKAADVALYEAKGAGRDCCMLHVISQQLPFTESPEWQQSPN